MPERSLGDPGAESGRETFCSVPSKNGNGSLESNELGYAINVSV